MDIVTIEAGATKEYYYKIDHILSKDSDTAFIKHNYIVKNEAEGWVLHKIDYSYYNKYHMNYVWRKE